MQRRFTLLSALVVLALAGCGPEQAGSTGIVGDWTVDGKRARADFVKHLDTLRDVASDADKPEFEERKRKLLDEEPLRMALSFKADLTYEATTTIDGKPHVARGTWKKAQGTWRLTQTREDGEELAKPSTITFRLEEGQLVGGRDPELPLHFKRD